MTSRCVKGILIGIFLLVAQALKAQQQPPTLETMLSDTRYILNRYEELVTGVDCDAWRAPDSLKRTCKDELTLIASNVQSVKPVLDRAVKARNVDLVDLFDVFQGLDEIAGHLDELSRNLADFTDPDAVPYAQAGSKALMSAAQLSNEIRKRLVAQQVKLAHCGRE